ncbi:MAG: HK97 gp10 family phage protein [Planctomycetaceae bacterium]
MNDTLARQMNSQFALECDAGELVNFLDEFEKKKADKLLRRAVGAGATKGAQLVRRETPVGKTGNLRRAIGRLKLRAKVADGRVNFIFGALKKKAKSKASASHFHLVTGGTKARRRSLIGGKFRLFNKRAIDNRGTGTMPANPFVVRTAMQSGAAIASAIHMQAAKDLSDARYT